MATGHTGVFRNLELHGLRVLIVEDVSDDSDLAIHQLARGGIRCSHVRADSEPSFRRALSGFRSQDWPVRSLFRAANDLSHLRAARPQRG